MFSLLEILNLLKLSHPFIKNKNSVLPILIEKIFEQKIYFCLLKMRFIFFTEGKSNFFYLTWTEITEIIFSTLCKKFKIFPFILFEKSRLAQGIRQPKAADSPLLCIHVFSIMSTCTNNNLSEYFIKI